MIDKTCSMSEVLQWIHDGQTILCGGFGVPGTPFTLIEGILDKGTTDHTVIINSPNEDAMGMGKLVEANRVTKLITSHVGLNRTVMGMMNRAEVEVEFCPQGILAERIRAGGAGLFGVLSDIGIDTIYREKKQIIEFEGRPVIIEPAIRADVALIHAACSDRYGNLIYAKTARNFSTVMAMAADRVIAEVEEIRELGQLDPDQFIRRVSLSTTSSSWKHLPLNMECWKSMSYKEKIAVRAAQEIQPGQTVNFGMGIPNLIPLYMDTDKDFFVHSENGILGLGPHTPRGEEDRNLIGPDGAYVTLVPGASIFDTATSFCLARCGRLDITFLGALEVSENGDLANWIIPGKFAPGMGGGMELAQKAKRVIVTITHTTVDGQTKILKKCTLPLTARSCVSLIITELAVLEVTGSGLVLREIAKETNIQEVIQKTEASLIIPEQGIKIF